MANVMKKAVHTGVASALPSLPRSVCSRQSNRRNASRDMAYGQVLSAVQYQELRMRTIMARCNPTATITTESAAPQAAAPAPAGEAVPVSAMDIRVGKIVKCELHPDAESLYVEQIDVGEAEPRTIVSGLVKFVPVEQMQDRSVIVLCNLKPRNMRGVKSNGMVLCASDAAHENVEPLLPPAEAKAGERVWFGEGNENQPAPAEPNRVQKKKMWEEIQPQLKTSQDKQATFKGLTMLTSAGPVTTASLVGANIA